MFDLEHDQGLTIRAARTIVQVGGAISHPPGRTEASRAGRRVLARPADIIADHAAAMLLALVRQIPMQDRHLRTGVYDRSYAFPDWHLAGATLGLLGFGRIAQLMGRRMAAFDVKLIAHDPYVDPNCEPALW